MSTPEELQLLSWKSCEHSISYLFLFLQALVYRPNLGFYTVFKADKFSVHKVKRILLFKFSSLPHLQHNITITSTKDTVLIHLVLQCLEQNTKERLGENPNLQKRKRIKFSIDLSGHIQRLFSQNAGGDTQLHFYCGPGKRTPQSHLAVPWGKLRFSNFNLIKMHIYDSQLMKF